jgi:hypothetical protein
LLKRHRNVRRWHSNAVSATVLSQNWPVVKINSIIPIHTHPIKVLLVRRRSERFIDFASGKNSPNKIGVRNNYRSVGLDYDALDHPNSYRWIEKQVQIAGRIQPRERGKKSGAIS